MIYHDTVLNCNPLACYHYAVVVALAARQMTAKIDGFASIPSPNTLQEENMPKQLELYKCELCGNIVELLHAGPRPSLLVVHGVVGRLPP